MREQQVNPAITLSENDALDQTISEAATWLTSRQQGDGHWVFELEADATVPSEYILLNHYLGEIRDDLERQIANYLRRTQGEHGGWPLYHAGDFDLSASVKAYYALKLVGDDPKDAHMRRAREAILAHGGAARASVFARIGLALFEQVPWRATPWIRPEAMLMPKWAPFHIEKVSYWSRAVMVPLFVLAALKPKARNPRGIGIPELFTTPPEQVNDYLKNPTGQVLGDMFLALDQVGRDVRTAASALGRALRDRESSSVHQGAAQWRGWSGRHLPGHGVCVHVLRCARLSSGSS